MRASVESERQVLQILMQVGAQLTKLIHFLEWTIVKKIEPVVSY